MIAGAPPVAVLPLAMVKRRGVRILRFLGHGISDYLGSVPIDAPSEIYGLFGAALADEARQFDLLDLQSIHADTSSRHALALALGRYCAERVYERCPIIDTTGAWEPYLGTRKKQFRANLKRADRRVAEAGRIEIGCETASAPLLKELVAVERASWKANTRTAFLLDPENLRFASVALLEESLPHEIWTLRINGVLTAFALVFTAGDTRYFYLTSFRRDHPDVGTKLLAEVVKNSFEGAWQVFDFLRGDERYKMGWSHREHTVYQVVACGQSLRGPFALAAMKLRWLLARSTRLQSLRAAMRVRLPRRSMR